MSMMMTNSKKKTNTKKSSWMRMKDKGWNTILFDIRSFLQSYIGVSSKQIGFLRIKQLDKIKAK